MKNVNLLLADDHKILRDGLRAMLENRRGYRIRAEATSGREVLELCGSHPVDVVLMDLNMPGMGGVETTGRLRDDHPGVKVLVLTMMEDTGTIRKAIEAGASGYLMKNSSFDEVVEAIDAVMKGNSYFSSEATRSIMEDSAKKEHNPGGELTEREVEVLSLICRELTNQEIADKLYLSVRTIDAHRRNLLQKTGARNTAGLVNYAHRHGLLSG